MEELDNTPARLRVSLETAARKAWEGGSEGYDGLSYYLKGSLVGLYFDLRIRELTAGMRSLDDVLIALDRDFGAHGRGYPDEAIREAISRAAGRDLTAEYEALVGGVGEMDWASVLAPAGLVLQRDSAPYLGVTLVDNQPSAIVKEVEAQSPGELTGLRAGDVIDGIDGQAVTSVTVPQIIRTHVGLAVFTIHRDNLPLDLAGQIGYRFTNYRLVPAQSSAGSTLWRHLFESTHPQRDTAETAK
jgi:predicted metalloprotease with PDZ domain